MVDINEDLLQWSTKFLTKRVLVVMLRGKVRDLSYARQICYYVEPTVRQRITKANY